MKSDMEKKVALFCGCTALFFAGGAAAQTSASSKSPNPAQGEATQLGEIIVTAQKREQNLQKVPIAITAITADVAEAANIHDVTSLQQVAPAINWGVGVGGGNVSIRGIAGTGSTGDESANAVYIDGVYQPFSTALMMSLTNIASIEILKGPQGTLFGRNASGGAILISTRDPSASPTANVSIGYANYNTIEGKGYVSARLSDTVSADLAAYYSEQNKGWGRDVTTGEDNYEGRSAVVRTKWKWTPSSRTSAVLAYTYSNLRPSILNGTGQVLAGEGRPYYGFYGGSANFPANERSIQHNGSVTITHETEWVTIKNIASFDYVNNPITIDGDYLPIRFVTVLPQSKTTSRSWTEELQLTSPATSKLVWAAGFFYFNNVNERLWPLAGAAFTPSGTTTTFGRSPVDSYALYGQATYPVLEHTRITGGLRYTKDDRSLTGWAISPAGRRTDYASSHTDKDWSWRAAVDQDLTPDLLLYASATTGFKSGFYNITAPSNPVTQPQKVKAYEIGSKSQLFDRRLRFNVAAFYYDFKNIQVRGASLLGPVFQNAASATVKGVDVDFQALPTPSLLLQGGLTYLDGSYDEFLNSPIYAPGPGGIGIVQTGYGNASHNSLPRSPHVSVSFSATQTWDLPNGGNVKATVAIYHNSGFFFDPQNRLPQPKYNLVNLSLNWAPTEKINITLWGNNLADEHYYSTIDTGTPIGDIYKPNAPRTYGVTFGYKLF